MSKAFPSALLLVVLLLSACATQVAPPPGPLNWPQQQLALAAVEHWSISGKLGARSSSDSLSAQMNWQQSPQGFEIILSGAFGRSATLRGDSSGVVLQQAGQPERRAADAEELSRQLTGWSLPLNSLPYWVRALPDPSYKEDKLLLNALGLPAERHQNGWLIAYSRYRHHGEVLLPGKIVVQQGDKKVTLIIRQWLLPDAPNL